MTLGTLMLSLLSGTLMGYTAMLGGQVRHTEVQLVNALNRPCLKVNRC